MPGGSALVGLFPIVLMVLLLWWMSRSQKKQQQQRQQQLDSMKVGDGVVTIGGLHGVISEINKEKGTVTLDCEGIYLEFDRQAIKSNKPSGTAPVATPTTVVDSKTIESSTDEAENAAEKTDAETAEKAESTEN